MVDRQEVEALLLNVALATDENKCQPADVVFQVEGDTLAALCRAWLAVDGGIVATLSRNDVDAMALPDSWSGQRVRIVKEAGE